MLQHVFERDELALRKPGSKQIDFEGIDGAVFGGLIFSRVGSFDIGVAVRDPGSFRQP